MIIRLASFIAAGCLVWQWDNRRRAREQERALQQSKAKPADVTTWEGEGGALPTVGPQLGPAPSHS